MESRVQFNNELDIIAESFQMLENPRLFFTMQFRNTPKQGVGWGFHLAQVFILVVGKGVLSAGLISKGLREAEPSC